MYSFLKIRSVEWKNWCSSSHHMMHSVNPVSCCTCQLGILHSQLHNNRSSYLTCFHQGIAVQPWFVTVVVNFPCRPLICQTNSVSPELTAVACSVIYSCYCFDVTYKNVSFSFLPGLFEHNSWICQATIHPPGWLLQSGALFKTTAAVNGIIQRFTIIQDLYLLDTSSGHDAVLVAWIPATLVLLWWDFLTAQSVSNVDTVVKWNSLSSWCFRFLFDGFSARFLWGRYRFSRSCTRVFLELGVENQNGCRI